MKCASLISGSKANCFYVESESSAILVDAGLSLPKLQQSFINLDIDINKLKGILVTHEHDDHVRHLRRISSYLQLPVYITEKSLKKSGLALREHHVIQPDQHLEFGDIEVEAFRVLHDAEMCLGFVFRNQGKKLFFASDIGSFDDGILRRAEYADFIGIESNYDRNMLRQCGYPQYLKDRISSGSGHLSNDEASIFVRESLTPQTKNVMFLHISENSNCPSHIEKMIDRHLLHASPLLVSTPQQRYSSCQPYLPTPLQSQCFSCRLPQGKQPKYLPPESISLFN